MCKENEDYDRAIFFGWFRTLPPYDLGQEFRSAQKAISSRVFVIASLIAPKSKARFGFDHAQEETQPQTLIVALDPRMHLDTPFSPTP